MTGYSFQFRLLQQLGTYRFLSPNQFMLAGSPRSKKTLHDNLQSLRARKLCDKTAYSYSQLYGRKEDIWHLLPKGAELLHNIYGYPSASLKASKHKVKVVEDYEHRKMIITSHIVFRHALEKQGVELLFYDYDFEKKKKVDGRGIEGATKIKTGSSFLKSDAIFLIQQGQQIILFCVEIHNQFRVTKLTKQLRPYAYVLAQGTAAEKYNLKTNPHILILFEEESTMRTSLELVADDAFYLNMKGYFHFKTINDFMTNPLDKRLDLHKQFTSLLSTNSPSGNNETQENESMKND